MNTVRVRDYLYLGIQIYETIQQIRVNSSTVKGPQAQPGNGTVENISFIVKPFILIHTFLTEGRKTFLH